MSAWKIFRTLPVREPVSRNRKFLVRGVLATLGLGAVEVLRPWPLKWVFDYLLLDGPVTGAFAGLADWMRGDPVWGSVLAALVIVGLGGAQAGLVYAQQISLATVAQRTVLHLRARALKHLLTLSLGVRSSQIGDLITRMTQDATGLRMLLARVLVDASAAAVIFLAVAVMLFVVDMRLGIAAMSVVPLVTLAAWLTSGRVRAAMWGRRQKEGEAAARAQEVLHSMKAVQAFAQEDAEDRWYEDTTSASLDESIRARRLQIGLARVNQVMNAGGLAVLLVVGARLVLRGELTPGDLIVALAYGRTLYFAIARFMRLAVRGTASLALAERLAEVFLLEPEIKPSLGAIRAPRFLGKVEFRDVSFGYARGQDVLRNVSFVVNPGESVAIVGPTGAGKSTLLNLLLRFVDPREGQVFVDDTDVRDFDVSSYRAQFRSVFQDATVLGRTVEENIAYGREGAEAKKVRVAARRSGVARFVEGLPEGYETRVGESGARISGGQRQSVAFARALLSKGSLVVLDEPSSWLDSYSELKMMASLRKITEGRTSFLVAHRFNTILDSDRVLYLQDGRVVGFASHDDLVEQCAPYRRLCELQFGDAEGMALSRTRTREGLKVDRAPNDEPRGTDDRPPSERLGRQEMRTES